MRQSVVKVDMVIVNLLVEYEIRTSEHMLPNGKKLVQIEFHAE